MIKEYISNIFLFFILLILQVIIFNNINLMGYANPMIYTLFLIKYPYKENRMDFLILSFLLGLAMDTFLDTGGIFATSAVIVSYIRPILLKFCFNKNIEYQKLRFYNFPMPNVWLYVSLIVLINTSFIYFLEAFDFSHWTDTITRISVNSALTIIFCMIAIFLFEKRKV